MNTAAATDGGAQVDPGDIPRRSASVQHRKVGDDTLLMHRILKQYHVLNGVAGRIWELCDGTETADGIAAAIAGEYKADAETVRRDVRESLSGMAALQLIELGEAP
ncbi:MAG: PqqD family protein [Rhodobacter sp.]|nr:PqqD family protein [Rhodobacter sp.]